MGKFKFRARTRGASVETSPNITPRRRPTRDRLNSARERPLHRRFRPRDDSQDDTPHEESKWVPKMIYEFAH